MSKIAVVYWSGTGNTEAMADLVANAAQSAGATVDKMTSAEFNAADAANYDGFALGCPPRRRRAAPAPPTVGGLPDEADEQPRPPFRYCRRRFSAVRVRKREIFLGMRGFWGFLEGGLEKVRGVFFEEIFEMMFCDALFLI